ncbi:hypothetical protein DFJ73DRAFT_902585, partial [Zopfochytrium polystomum]
VCLGSDTLSLSLSLVLAHSLSHTYRHTHTHSLSLSPRFSHTKMASPPWASSAPMALDMGGRDGFGSSSSSSRRPLRSSPSSSNIAAAAAKTEYYPPPSRPPPIGGGGGALPPRKDSAPSAGSNPRANLLTSPHVPVEVLKDSLMQNWNLKRGGTGAGKASPAGVPSPSPSSARAAAAADPADPRDFLLSPLSAVAGDRRRFDANAGTGAVTLDRRKADRSPLSNDNRSDYFSLGRRRGGSDRLADGGSGGGRREADYDRSTPDDDYDGSNFEYGMLPSPSAVPGIGAMMLAHIEGDDDGDGGYLQDDSYFDSDDKYMRPRSRTIAGDAGIGLGRSSGRGGHGDRGDRGDGGAGTEALLRARTAGERRPPARTPSPPTFVPRPPPSPPPSVVAPTLPVPERRSDRDRILRDLEAARSGWESLPRERAGDRARSDKNATSKNSEKDPASRDRSKSVKDSAARGGGGVEPERSKTEKDYKKDRGKSDKDRSRSKDTAAREARKMREKLDLSKLASPLGPPPVIPTRKESHTIQPYSTLDRSEKVQPSPLGSAKDQKDNTRSRERSRSKARNDDSLGRKAGPTTPGGAGLGSRTLPTGFSLDDLKKLALEVGMNESAEGDDDRAPPRERNARKNSRDESGEGAGKGFLSLGRPPRAPPLPSNPLTSTGGSGTLGRIATDLPTTTAGRLRTAELVDKNGPINFASSARTGSPATAGPVSARASPFGTPINGNSPAITPRSAVGDGPSRFFAPDSAVATTPTTANSTERTIRRKQSRGVVVYNAESPPPGVAGAPDEASNDDVLFDGRAVVEALGMFGGAVMKAAGAGVGAVNKVVTAVVASSGISVAPDAAAADKALPSLPPPAPRSPILSPDTVDGESVLDLVMNDRPSRDGDKDGGSSRLRQPPPRRDRDRRLYDEPEAAAEEYESFGSMSRSRPSRPSPPSSTNNFSYATIRRPSKPAPLPVATATTASARQLAPNVGEARALRRSSSVPELSAVNAVLEASNASTAAAAASPAAGADGAPRLLTAKEKYRLRNVAGTAAATAGGGRAGGTPISARPRSKTPDPPSSTSRYLRSAGGPSTSSLASATLTRGTLKPALKPARSATPSEILAADLAEQFVKMREAEAERERIRLQEKAMRRAKRAAKRREERRAEREREKAAAAPSGAGAASGGAGVSEGSGTESEGDALRGGAGGGGGGGAGGSSAAVAASAARGGGGGPAAAAAAPRRTDREMVWVTASIDRERMVKVMIPRAAGFDDVKRLLEDKMTAMGWVDEEATTGRAESRVVIECIRRRDEEMNLITVGDDEDWVVCVQEARRAGVGAAASDGEGIRLFLEVL